jgi:hypothetical protein
MDINIQDKHYNKYLKYKLKYLELKKQSGGGVFSYFYPNKTTKNYEEIKKKDTINDMKRMIIKIIPDLKSDLIKQNSKFHLELLNTFETNVLNSNIDIVHNLWRTTLGKNDHNNNIIEQIKKIGNIIETYINTNLKEMENKDTLINIINIYINIYISNAKYNLKI